MIDLHGIDKVLTGLLYMSVVGCLALLVAAGFAVYHLIHFLVWLVEIL